jgi:hypothetical protein
MKDLRKRMMEIDDAVEYLEEAGWVVERKAIEDKDGEPVRVMVRARWGPIRKEDVL